MKKLLLILVILLMLTGCANIDTDGEPSVGTPAEVEMRCYSTTQFSDVCLFTVEGVNCIVFRGNRAGGLSCDWSKP
jgi:uncharacterized protein YceK